MLLPMLLTATCVFACDTKKNEALPAVRNAAHIDVSAFAAELEGNYAARARRIIETVRANNDSWQKMRELCDGVGHRLSGSPQLERAVAWALESLKRDGQEGVRAEEVMVPKWVRGRESAAMVKPYEYELNMLGLGMSVGTPAEGITAPVIVVQDEASFEKASDRMKGKIVLFNNAMPKYDPEKGSGYGQGVRFRSRGPSMAASKGAVACLVRSVTAFSLRTPHTGATRYEEGIDRIPAAAITIEDAEMIERLTEAGHEVVVRLRMEARHEGLAPSANVVAELRGSEKPEEVVVIGGHLDSWDVGQGAHDDAGGCVMAMEAINVLRKMNLRPRRTIRVVLFTNEENGLAGGRAYAEQHAAELKNHVAAIESDSGAFSPEGFSIDATDENRRAWAGARLRAICKLLAPLGVSRIGEGWSGADISPMKPAGVMLMGLDVEGSRYFDYHHTPADTLDKVNPSELTDCVAAMSVMAYILADMPDRLGDIPLLAGEAGDDSKGASR